MCVGGGRGSNTEYRIPKDKILDGCQVCESGGRGGVSIYLSYKKRMLLEGAVMILLIIQKIIGGWGSRFWMRLLV